MRRYAVGALALVLALGARRAPRPARARRLSLEQVRDVIRSAGWPDAELDRATRVAMRESGGDPRAHLVVTDPAPGFGREDSRGLFQINVLAWPQYQSRDLYDASTNAATALEIWRRAGWGPWRTTAGP